MNRHIRFQITLGEEEGTALLNLATAELRDPREQARLIISKELKRRGLLASEPKKGEEHVTV